MVRCMLPQILTVIVGESQPPLVPASGDPLYKRKCWIPACAGMSGERSHTALAPLRRRVGLPVDRLHRFPGADDRAFLPAAPERDLVAGLVEAALRRRQH